MKYKIVIAISILLLAFAVGRYTAPKSVSTSETQIVDNTIKHTTIVKTPDGHETTTIDEHTTEHETQRQTETIIPKRSTVNISALIGTELTHGIQPLYGLSVSKEVLGNITAGVYGLNNGILGVSIGLNF